MDNRFTEFGLHLRALRLQKGLSQEEVAHRARIHVTYFSGVERGKRNPSLKTLYQIASALGVQTRDLLLPEES